MSTSTIIDNNYHSPTPQEKYEQKTKGWSGLDTLPENVTNKFIKRGQNGIVLPDGTHVEHPAILALLSPDQNRLQIAYKSGDEGIIRAVTLDPKTQLPKATDVAVYAPVDSGSSPFTPPPPQPNACVGAYQAILPPAPSNDLGDDSVKFTLPSGLPVEIDLRRGSLRTGDYTTPYLSLFAPNNSVKAKTLDPQVINRADGRSEIYTGSVDPFLGLAVGKVVLGNSSDPQTAVRDGGTVPISSWIMSSEDLVLKGLAKKGDNDELVFAPSKELFKYVKEHEHDILNNNAADFTYEPSVNGRGEEKRTSEIPMFSQRENTGLCVANPEPPSPEKTQKEQLCGLAPGQDRTSGYKVEETLYTPTGLPVSVVQKIDGHLTHNGNVSRDSDEHQPQRGLLIGDYFMPIRNGDVKAEVVDQTTNGFAVRIFTVPSTYSGKDHVSVDQISLGNSPDAAEALNLKNGSQNYMSRFINGDTLISLGLAEKTPVEYDPEESRTRITAPRGEVMSTISSMIDSGNITLDYIEKPQLDYVPGGLTKEECLPQESFERFGKMAIPPRPKTDATSN